MTVYVFGGSTRGRDGRPVRVVGDRDGWRCSCATEDGRLGPCAVRTGLRWAPVRSVDPETGKVRIKFVPILVEDHVTRAQRRATGYVGRGLPSVSVVYRDGGEAQVPALPDRRGLLQTLVREDLHRRRTHRPAALSFVEAAYRPSGESALADSEGSMTSEGPTETSRCAQPANTKPTRAQEPTSDVEQSLGMQSQSPSADGTGPNGECDRTYWLIEVVPRFRVPDEILEKLKARGYRWERRGGSWFLEKRDCEEPDSERAFLASFGVQKWRYSFFPDVGAYDMKCRDCGYEKHGFIYEPLEIPTLQIGRCPRCKDYTMRSENIVTNERYQEWERQADTASDVFLDLIKGARATGTSQGERRHS